MKYVCKQYNLETKKNICEKRFITISDLHLNVDINRSELDELVIQIMDKIPDYIFILGDITPYYYLENKKFREKLLYFFKLLSDIGKTYLIFGNKDYQANSSNNDFYVNTKRLIDIYQKANVLVPDNRLVKDEDLNIIGFNKSPLNYVPFELRDTSKLREEINELISKVQGILDDNRYTIFLTHSHLDLLKLQIEFLNSFDLILAGHTHNGLVPNFLEGIFPKTRSIITSEKLFQKDTRGIIQNGDQKIIVNGGITKISDSHSKVIKCLTKTFYPGEIDFIKITKTN